FGSFRFGGFRGRARSARLGGPEGAGDGGERGLADECLQLGREGVEFYFDLTLNVVAHGSGHHSGAQTPVKNRTPSWRLVSSAIGAREHQRLSLSSRTAHQIMAAS